ncbi:MAG: lytic transglycosylase domain-containing protein [Burkholderiales bacterium]|nr:lytic transglycosylase domain-containing protein [Burkholderiales bacterium]
MLAICVVWPPGQAAAQALDPAAATLAQPEPAARAAEAYQRDPAYRLLFPGVCVAAPDPPPAPLPVAPYAQQIDSAARAAGVDPALVHALVAVESAYRPAAVSPKGAVGLMQLLPATAERYGVTNLTDVPENLKAGTRHLRNLIDAFGDRLDLALAAYNAGEGAVRRHRNAVPPYRETRQYVPAVLQRYRPAPSVAVPPPAQPPGKPAANAHEYLPGTRLDPAAVAAAR